MSMIAIQNRTRLFNKTTIVLLLLVLIVLPTGLLTIQPVNSYPSYPSWARIAIEPDGTIENTIDNSSVPIQKNGNVYTLTGDLNGSLDIEANDVIVDGAGYKIQYPGGNAPRFGVTIYGGQHVTLMNTQITGFSYPLSLNTLDSGGSADNCAIINNTITESPGSWNVAIWVNGCNNTIAGNRITNIQGTGIYLQNGTGNIISDNYIADNTAYGISFNQASASLRNNRLDNNSLAFDFLEGTYGSPVEDIDSSNLVDGMPVYYGANQQNITVPSNAGYVYLVNCTNMNIQGLSIMEKANFEAKYDSKGIRIVNTRDSVISDCTLTVGTGISCYWSANVSIIGNTLTTGIQLYGDNVSLTDNTLTVKGIRAGSNSTVARNKITSCETGITLGSSNSRIFENNIASCDTGISLFSAFNNTFFHNNFINNSRQVYIEHYGGSPWDMYISHTYFPSENNTWDLGYPAGGNYWSNYTGVDGNEDGLGDTPHVVFENDTDRYPLMQPISSTFDTSYLLRTTPPKISLLSPTTQTYNESSVPLVFSIDKSADWIGCSLDGEETITIAGNITLTELSGGLHNVTVYANDTFGNAGKSETINFTIAEKPEPSNEVEVFPVTIIAAASGALVFLFGAAIFAYSRRKKLAV